MKTIKGKLFKQLTGNKIFFLCCCLFLHVSVYSQVRIPVVVHIISGNPDAITDAQIAGYIADLNHAFAHTGPYAGGPGVNTGISFCLAKTDPDGGITTGITRTESVLTDFDVDIEDSRTKNLISWDTKRYTNIWFVEGLKSEIYPLYSCGKWSRMKEAGYATFTSGGDFRDGIVLTAWGVLAAHEAGHYLGLKHTFIINDCANNNCDVDGDGVCDTPPSAVFGGSCTTPQNSCSTDTLSGFAIDQPDLNVNFMSYSSCANMFTAGQSIKMNDVLATTRNSLLAVYKCDPPCSENIVASFIRDNWFPVTGSTINFTSTSSGGSNYEWTIDDLPFGTNSPFLSHTFPINGRYKVKLKVYNSDKTCAAIYTHYVIVSCGVMARFYPDKRLIASKAPVYIDTILFANRSVNATSYRWLMSNDTGMTETVVSTDKDLNYPFLNSGNYTVRLIATNGACSDTTERFFFQVNDPVMDGTVQVSEAECYQSTKLRIRLYVCNGGYSTIPKGTPVSFYDRDPRLPGAVKIDTTFLVPDAVLGSCCSPVYTLILDIKKAGLNSLWAVFNDAGMSLPVVLPNTTILERDLRNNFSVISNFQLKATITPPSATLQPGDTLRLIGKATPGISTYLWSPLTNLSCDTCHNPFFVAKKNDARLKLEARNSWGCVDSAFADIKVPPADDLVLKINSIDCARGDSLRVNFEICNKFKRGTLTKGLKTSFYDGDPGAGGKLMGPVFSLPSDVNSACATYTHIIKGTGRQKIYIVVNDKGVVPFKMPNDSVMLESDYSNNQAIFDYTPEEVKIIPADTAVLRGSSLNLSIASTIYDPASIRWNNGAGYTLSCTSCLIPKVTVRATDTVTMQMLNRYGCFIKGRASVRLLPPDMTVRILRTDCYSDKKTLVRFRICMNNGYDSVFKGIPVSFYNRDPNAGSRQMLDSTFYTARLSPTGCDSFTAIINTPEDGVLYLAVNDKGNGSFPDKVYDETDFTNNTANTIVTRFTVTVIPPDTVLYRNSSIRLLGSASGGTLTSYTWKPDQFLSCVNCLDPIVKLPYTQSVVFTGKNQYSCTSSDTAVLTMYTDGPVNIPNAFTPNGDGKNDVFYILGSRDIELVKDLSVYDRYGQRVFQVKNVPANDPAFGWRGQVQGKNAATGTFVYAANIRFADGTERLFKGTITLIR